MRDVDKSEIHRFKVNKSSLKGFEFWKNLSQGKQYNTFFRNFRNNVAIRDAL